jgi:hypothetical protein
MAYKLLLMAPDGDYVTEGTDKGYTADECCEISANMGSRWIFYPFHFVIKDRGPVRNRQKVIEPPDGMSFLKGKSMDSVTAYMQKHGEEIAKHW